MKLARLGAKTTRISIQHQHSASAFSLTIHPAANQRAFPDE